MIEKSAVFETRERERKDGESGGLSKLMEQTRSGMIKMVTSRLQSEYGKVKWLTDERVFIVQRQLHF